MFQNPIFPLGAADMRVELDKKSLFALASDTRLDILRSLQPMRRTVSQLAESLEIDKAAVYRHLKKMEEGGLVKKYEDHGFVYYGLTWKARDLMSPNENTRIVILLSSTWLLAAAVLMMLLLALVAQGYAKSSYGLPPEAAERGYGELVDLTGGSAGTLTIWIVVMASLAIIATVFGGLSWRRLRKPKQRNPPPRAFSKTEGERMKGPID
jgi:DNA-binding transcriptional ArsR family regulator